MSLRPSPENRKVPGTNESEQDSDNPRDHALLSLRSTVIFLTATLVGIIAGSLTYLAGHQPPYAVLIGLGAFAGAIPVINRIVD